MSREEEITVIVGIHHIAIGVPDFEAGLAFYRGRARLRGAEL